MMMRVFIVVAVFLHLVTANTAQAQNSSSASLWQSISTSTSDAMNTYFWGPIRSVSQSLFNTEERFAAHLDAFKQTLRTDMRRIESLAGRAGYKLSTVTMNPGIIPAVSVTFSFSEKISPADEAKLRSEMAALSGLSGALERGIILGLLDLEKTVEGIRPDGFRISEVEMALVAIFPEIAVSFSRGD
jgi:hypothetical protein